MVELGFADCARQLDCHCITRLLAFRLAIEIQKKIHLPAAEFVSNRITVSSGFA